MTPTYWEQQLLSETMLFGTGSNHEHNRTSERVSRLRQSISPSFACHDPPQWPCWRRRRCPPVVSSTIDSTWWRCRRVPRPSHGRSRIQCRRDCRPHCLSSVSNDRGISYDLFDQCPARTTVGPVAGSSHVRSDELCARLYRRAQCLGESPRWIRTRRVMSDRWSDHGVSRFLRTAEAVGFCAVTAVTPPGDHV